MPSTTMASEKKPNVLDLLQRRISHPRIAEVIREIEAFESLGANHILMVTGPTGVGKTTLAHTLLTRMLKRHQSAMQENKGHIPAILIEAKATSETDFNWKLFYSDILEQLEGGASSLPAIAYGVDPLTNRTFHPVGKSQNTAAGLRRKVELALRARGVRTLMIDEGGHFTNVSNALMKRQTDALKSLSNCADCQIIMFGSYDILGVSRLSAQLARRIKEIHFSRYRTDSPDDAIAFARFIQRIENDCENYFDGLLKENAKLLQANTLGCVGTLMDVVRGFASRSQAQNEVSQTLLERSLLTQGQHVAILDEIRQGETRFESDFLVSKKQRASNEYVVATSLPTSLP